MEFLIVNRLRDSADERLGPAIRDHLRWVTHGLRTGDLVRAGRWGRDGMCIIEEPDETSAATILGADPLVAEGLVDFEMAAITPAADAEVVASDASDVPAGGLSEGS